MAGRTGPTPKLDGVARRRSPAGKIRATSIDFPPPPEHWTAATVADYDSFIASDIARAVEPESLSTVMRLYEIRNAKAREWRRWDDDTATVEAQREMRQRIRTLEDIDRRLSDALGIGPVAKARLGIAPTPAPNALDAFLAGDE